MKARRSNRLLVWALNVVGAIGILAALLLVYVQAVRYVSPPFGFGDRAEEQERFAQFVFSLREIAPAVAGSFLLGLLSLVGAAVVRLLSEIADAVDSIARTSPGPGADPPT